MTNSIQATPSGPGPNEVRLSTGEIISWQTINHVYSTVKGSSETLSKRILKNHKTTFNDIHELHDKIHRVTGPFVEKTITETVTVFYVNGYKIEHSSFAKFAMDRSNTNKCVENVRLEYKIIATIGAERYLKEFKISVDIHSNVASAVSEQKNVLENIPFLQFLNKISGVVEVEFQDYASGKMLLNCVVEWFEELHESEDSKISQFFQNNADECGWLSRLLVPIIATICFSYAVTADLIDSIEDSTIILISFIGMMFTITIFSMRFQSIIAKSLRGMGACAYVNLSSGDEKAIEQFANNRKTRIMTALRNLLYQLVISVIGAGIYAYFSGLMV